MAQVKIIQEFWTDSGKIRSTSNHRKNMGGTKQNVKRCTSWHKKITLTRSRGPNICVMHQSGPSSSIALDPTNRCPPDPTIAQQFNWKIICTKSLEKAENQLVHKSKIEYAKTTSSQLRTAAELGSTKKIGWRFWDAFFNLIQLVAVISMELGRT